jgi:hypothetical protein
MSLRLLSEVADVSVTGVFRAVWVCTFKSNNMKQEAHERLVKESSNIIINLLVGTTANTSICCFIAISLAVHTREMDFVTNLQQTIYLAEVYLSHHQNGDQTNLATIKQDTWYKSSSHLYEDVYSLITRHSKQGYMFVVAKLTPTHYNYHRLVTSHTLLCISVLVQIHSNRLGTGHPSIDQGMIRHSNRLGSGHPSIDQ